MSIAGARAVLEPVTFSTFPSPHLNSVYSDANAQDDPYASARSWQSCLHTPSGAAPVAFDARSLTPHTQSTRECANKNASPFAANAAVDVNSEPSGPKSGRWLPKETVSELPSPAPLNADTRVAVIGVGFVGASLLEQFIKAFPRAIGYDVSPTRITQLRNQYRPPNGHANSKLTLTTDAEELRNAAYFLIAVPTLLRCESKPVSINTKTGAPKTVSRAGVNLDFVCSAIDLVVKHCRPGSVVVIESSVSVGTTRSLLSPHSHLVHGGMSPERVDPGRVTPKPSAIPKLVSGLTPIATLAITALYSSCYDHIIPVSSPEVAEMTKLHENSFRMINIAYANEIADACRSLGIEFKEVVEAASTKPYGFLAFSAGLGIGGHCIPVNPYYLFSSCRKGALPLLERATKTMKQRPRRLAKAFFRRVVLEMARQTGVRAVDVTVTRLPRILFVGLAFKPGVSTLTYSPGLAFASTIKQMGCTESFYYDPLVSKDMLGEDLKWLAKLSDIEWFSDDLRDKFDGIAICVKQHGIDWSVFSRERMRSSCYVRWFA